MRRNDRREPKLEKKQYVESERRRDWEREGV